MDKIVPGLAVAAVSALTFIAYRHQSGYAALFVQISHRQINSTLQYRSG
jgi:hypothetical protein